jgi:IS30 family transposase
LLATHAGGLYWSSQHPDFQGVELTDFQELKARFFDALDREDGNIAAAIRAVGVNRNTAYSWARIAGQRGKGLRPRHPGAADYQRLRAQGLSRRDAAARTGVPSHSAAYWDSLTEKHAVSVSVSNSDSPVGYNTGVNTAVDSYVLPPTQAALQARLHPRFITLIEREQIADLHREGLSLREIGRQLGRRASTIKREIDNRSSDGQYRPYAAHRASVAARARPKPRKLASAGRLRDYVQSKLDIRWSPEQISHTLITEFPDDHTMRVCMETIYQAIYLQARGGLKREMVSALRTGRIHRQPRKAPRERATRFIDEGTLISQRPPEADDRAVPGHWEGDLIMGEGNRSQILTAVERSTRYTMLGYLPEGHTAHEVREVLVEMFQSLPAHLRGSLTWDQGCEMAGHLQFSVATNVPVYFCDPHSPWQRGSNENTNGLLRQYFPKGTDLSVHSREDLEYVAQELNGRPRKTLGWDTPAQRLHALLSAT